MADYSKAHLNQIIDEYINFETCGAKADRNREILRRRLIDGVLYEPLAENFKSLCANVKASFTKQEKSCLNTFKPPIMGGYFLLLKTSYKLRESRLFVSYTTGGFFAILGTEREAQKWTRTI